jgi:sugar transferase EpsL
MKRFFDLVVSGLLLIVLCPVIAGVALVSLAAMGRPLLFRQERPGLNGAPFTMYKFRTMSNAQKALGQPLEDSQRLGSYGRFLRASSLDELPELWNVLRGEMSLVGPRPLLKEYLSLYTPHQARRHEVRPGITGWTQVNGRNALSWDEKFKLDVWYVDNRSFLLDLKILGMTLLSVISRRGINNGEHATMPPFQGQR